MDKDYRADERQRREAAQAGTAEVQGGQEVRPRVLKQMVSLRLEPELLRDLRLFADERGVSVSDVLRQAAVDFLDRAHRSRYVLSAGQTQIQQPISVSWAQGHATGVGVVANTPSAA